MIDTSEVNVIRIKKETGFSLNYIERALRLTDVLEGLFSSEWGDKIALRGGTAINFFFVKLSRLSVDLDLDFLATDRDTMLLERERFKDYLVNMMYDKDFSPYDKTRSNYSLDHLRFAFFNNRGGSDIIKIEINYLNRTHIAPPKKMELDVFGYVSPVKINVVDCYDLYGGKLSAYVNRTLPRDVFDVAKFVETLGASVDMSMLRKSFIFYECLGGGRDLLNLSADDVTKRTRGEIYRALQSSFPRGIKYDADAVQEEIAPFMGELLKFSDDERMFISAFNEGVYEPKLLFGNTETAVRVGWHPAAFSRCKSSSLSEQEEAMKIFERMQGRGESSLDSRHAGLLEDARERFGGDDTFNDLYFGRAVFPTEDVNVRELLSRLCACSDDDAAVLTVFKSSGQYDPSAPDESYLEIVEGLRSGGEA